MFDLFKVILNQELRIIFKTKSRIIANIFYFYIFLSIFQILIKNYDKNFEHNLFIISIILAVFLSIICVNNGFLNRDSQDGTIEQIIIHCPNLEIYFFAKCLANYLSSSVLIIINACIFYKFMGFDDLRFYQLFTTLTLSSLSLGFLISLCETVGALGLLSSIIVILALPLSLPILILTNLCFDNFENNIKILLALSMLTISISCLAGAKLIRISND